MTGFSRGIKTFSRSDGHAGSAGWRSRIVSRRSWIRKIRSMRTCQSLVLWACAIFLLLFTGCELKLGGGRNKGEDKPTALPVALQSVERGDISSSLRLNGTLEARRELMIYSRSPGRLDELLVEEGDRIQNGQLLARLEDVEQRLRQERARASLAQQQSTLRRMEE